LARGCLSVVRSEPLPPLGDRLSFSPAAHADAFSGAPLRVRLAGFSGEHEWNESLARRRARSAAVVVGAPFTYGASTARTPASFSGFATRRMVRTIPS
jgi:hypothetical protein